MTTSCPPAAPSRRAFLGTGLGALAVVSTGLVACSDDGDAAQPAADQKTVEPKIDRTPVTPLARSHHATALLGGGLVLVIGGQAANGTLVSCQVFNADADEWYDAAPLSIARGLLSATPLPDGTVLTLGGFDGTGALGVGSVFDPAKDTWTAAKPLRTPRYLHGAQPLGDGRVVVTGGFSQGPLADAEIYEV